jgi:DNA polymerase III delta prime subunit
MFDVNLKEVWRPTSLSDAVVLPRILSRFPDGKLVDNYLFYGSHGMGKTSLAKILAAPFDWRYWNISEKTGIGIIRNEIIPFLSTVSSKSVFGSESSMKVVVLDELEAASEEFFDAFRATVEQFPHHRFIGTTNYINRIPPPCLSRFQLIDWTPANAEEEVFIKNGYAKRIKTICATASVAIQPDAVKRLILDHYPDMRQMLSQLSVAFAQGVNPITAESIKPTESVGYSPLFELLYMPPDAEENWKQLYQWKDKYKESMHAIANGFPEWLATRDVAVYAKSLGAILVAIAEWQAKMPQMIDPFLALLAVSHQIQTIIKEAKK